VVAAAKRGSGGGGKSQRGGGGKAKQQKQQAAVQAPRSKTLHMAECKADEILCFDPVPAARGALQVRDSGGALPCRQATAATPPLSLRSSPCRCCMPTRTNMRWASPAWVTSWSGHSSRRGQMCLVGPGIRPEAAAACFLRAKKHPPSHLLHLTESV
jgi:hypothetical protein